MNITNVSRSIFTPLGAYDALQPILSQSISFSDSFTEFVVHGISQSLSFSDSFTHSNKLSPPFSQSISFVSSFIVEHDLSRTISQSLVFTDSLIWNGLEYTSQSLVFSQSLIHSNILVRTLSNTLTFTDKIFRAEKIRQALLFVDSFEVLYSNTIFTDVLHFNDQFIHNVTVPQDINDHLFFNDHFGLHGRYTYSWHDVLIFPEPYTNKLIDNSYITIPNWVIFINRKNDYNKYLFLRSQNGSIMLASPLFGDLQSNIAEVRINRTVGGARYSYVKTSSRKHLKYEFNMRQDKYNELITFLDETNLDLITLTNWKEETWLVRIVNNPIILKAIKRDTYSVILEFEGFKSINGNYLCLE